MNKQVKYTYEGANQDITKSKHPFQFYFEGQHIKILATDTQSTGSVTNEKGNELVITLPSIRIIGKQNIPVQAVDNNSTVLIGKKVLIPILDNDIFLYPVTITITTPPVKGTLTINNTNTVTYTNTDNIVGTDTIIYQIDDGTTTDTASIIIKVTEVIVDPIIDNDIIDSNFDGIFYYYRFAPCNITLSFVDIKTTIKVNDFTNIYGLLGYGSIGYEGKVAWKINPTTNYCRNLGDLIGTKCPQETIRDFHVTKIE